MSDEQYKFPFDPYDEKEENLIEGELHTISPPNFFEYLFIVPRFAPFFRSSLKVRLYEDGKELLEGVDYALSFYFYEASSTTARPIYGAISFYDRELSGTVEIDYRTVGGQWAIDEQKATELLASVQYNPRSATWEQVVGLPEHFPVIEHDHHLKDIVGMSDLLESLGDIRSALSTDGADQGYVDDRIDQLRDELTNTFETKLDDHASEHKGTHGISDDEDNAFASTDYVDDRIQSTRDTVKSYTDNQLNQHSDQGGGVHGVPEGEQIEWKSAAQKRIDDAFEEFKEEREGDIDAHAEKTGNTHGVPEGERIEWQSQAQAKADTAKQEARSYAYDQARNARDEAKNYFRLKVTGDKSQEPDHVIDTWIKAYDRSLTGEANEAYVEEDGKLKLIYYAQRSEYDLTHEIDLAQTLDKRYLLESNNLSDLENKETARNNLGVMSEGEVENFVYDQIGGNSTNWDRAYDRSPTDLEIDEVRERKISITIRRENSENLIDSYDLTPSMDARYVQLENYIPGEWGKIVGDITDQSDLVEKFGEYLTQTKEYTDSEVSSAKDTLKSYADDQAQWAKALSKEYTDEQLDDQKQLLQAKIDALEERVDDLEAELEGTLKVDDRLKIGPYEIFYNEQKDTLDVQRVDGEDNGDNDD